LKSQHLGASEGAAAGGLVALLVEADGVVDGGSGRRCWFLGAAPIARAAAAVGGRCGGGQWRGG